MEAGDPGARQSGPPLGPSHDSRSRPPSLHHHHHASYRPQQSQPLEHSGRDHPGHSMAAVSVFPPANHYPHMHSASNSYSTSSNPSNTTRIMSSEPHKGTPVEKDPSSRQSLPSISDVLKVAEPPGPYGSPASSAMPSSSSFPSPYPSATNRNPYDTDKHPSPRGQQRPAFPPRQEPPTAYAETSRASFASSRPQVLPPVSDRRPSPPVRPDMPPQHHMQEPPKPHEPHHPHNGVYAQSHAPLAAPPPSQSAPYSHGPLPPGQYPLPPHPISPRHTVPPPPPTHAYDSRAPPPHPEQPDYASHERARHEASLHLEPWDYTEALSRISSGSRTVFQFCESYHRLAQEQHGSHPTLDRLPTDAEIASVIANTDLIKRSLEQVRELVQQSARTERLRDASRPPKTQYDDEDMGMYGGGDMKTPGYAMGETKKRRGRAAPPGRCHSCNRIDTPEWRRGPDGARTLCNACGLHYAKLERKRQMEQKQQQHQQQQQHRPRHE